MFRTLALALIITLLAMPAVAGGSAQEKVPKSEQPSAERQAPRNPPPPRSSGRDPNSSSSRENIIDLSPPPGDRGSHPQHPPAGDGEVSEMQPYDPHKAEKNIEVGDYYFKRGNYKAAISRFREALQWKPNDALATFRLAQALEKMSELGEAYTLYQKYVELLPTGPFAVEARSAVKRLQPHIQMRAAVPNKSIIDRNLENGRRFLREGKYESALMLLREVIQLDAKNPEGLFLLAQTLEATSDKIAARQHYYSYINLYPQGEFAAQAKAALARLSTEPHPSAGSGPTSQSAQTPR